MHARRPTSVALEDPTAAEFPESASTDHSSSHLFDTSGWLLYFEENKSVRPLIRLHKPIGLADSLRLPLLKSLQRFQIGETGDGKHLRKYASRIGDSVYEKCVDMFIKEEQAHAQILAQVITAIDGELLTWHWTDIAFIALRRVLGLKTELFILLIAEIIGKTFYKCVAKNVGEEVVRNIFSLIVLDEIAHLQFHSEFLHSQLKHYPEWAKSLVRDVWFLIFFAACIVFVADHKKTLIALGSSPRVFIRECSAVFHRSASIALGRALEPDSVCRSD